MNSVHSRDIEDEVFSTLYYPEGATAQISVNWSDESQRKMSTKISIWGTGGRITVSRQDCAAYLRDARLAPPGYEQGWNVRNTTDAVDDVYFYLRGEEYSAQEADFIERVKLRETEGVNTFETAALTDKVLSMMSADAESGIPKTGGEPPAPPHRRRLRRWLGRRSVRTA